MTPYEYLPRQEEIATLEERITSTPPQSHCFVVTGVRGSGKTVLLTALQKRFELRDDWIVIELNPEDDMREGLAAKLYTSARVKKLFFEKNFSVSFQGISFSLTGKNPVMNVEDLLSRMFQEIKRKNKKVLVIVDEASNSAQMKRFALTFQMLIRQDFPLFAVMTGLYENISALENEKNLTFLIRSPRVTIGSLSLSGIATSYQHALNLSYEDAVRYAKITKGYAFAFQLFGNLLYENEGTPDSVILGDFDQQLETYVYRKIWSTLTPMEKTLLRFIKTNGPIACKEIYEAAGVTKEYFSQYRSRLIGKGIIMPADYGQVIFALPRFREFIDRQLDW